MEIFYAATMITLGNGKKTPFWQAPWLHGRKLIDIAHVIYAVSKRKNWKVSHAMNGEAWIRKITLDASFSLDHFSQFVDLWSLLSTINLNPKVEDNITWRLTPSGNYTVKLAYELQLLVSTASPMNKRIWKAWAPPKVKFFAWLANQGISTNISFTKLRKD
ncbi:uncharacterized protein [Lolium perenne]|uniref:uncharacterized protein n=1 Tax=Lolium perenne TaxID=4522 RepID=UPI003A996490